MSKDLGFGIIGCGVISNWHADAVNEVDGAYIAGATDVNQAALRSFSEKYGIESFKSIDELLSSDKIDVVCVCTPSGLHTPIAVKAANAGKHVVVEKPMALNLKQCDEIIKACENNDIKMGIISQTRLADSVIKVKEAIDKKWLGKLLAGDIYMKFYRSQEYYDSGGWRGTWEMDGGGALMNQGIHGIDLLQYLMGPVKSVYAYARTMVRNIEVEDTAAALVEYKNGAIGVIEGTTSVFPGYPRRLEINGDKGSIILENLQVLKWDIKGEELPSDLTKGTTSKGSSSDPKAFSIEGHVKQIKDMVSAVNNNSSPFVNPYEGRKPIEIIMAIYESSKTGRRIEL